MNIKAITGFTPYARLSDGTCCYGVAITDGRTLTNTSAQALTISELVLFAGHTGISQDSAYYGEGYHMLTQYRGNVNERGLVGAYGDDKSFFHLPDNPFDGELFVVYYLLRYREPDGRHTLLAFTSCDKYIGKFRLRGDYLEIVLDMENKALSPGQSVRVEEFSAWEGYDREALMAYLAAAIDKNHPMMKWGAIPTGWCSYYCMGTDITPQALYDNALSMAQRVPELDMIQVDAGTNTCDGDWMTPKFDDDLPAICKKIRSRGVNAGGYLAPFIVHKDSALAKDHPDWMIQGQNGPTNEFCHNPNWYILDGSHPGARAYLKKIIRWMYDECALRYFNLDFLAYGALGVGRRYDPGMTGVESYRAAMTAMIEEMGPDSFVLACNAPFWPTLGLCHGQRVTNDIFRSWKLVSGNARELFGRNWQHERLWINDPDCVVLERVDIKRSNGQVRPCTLTDDEFEFHKAFALCCGGMILSGDLLESISEKSIDALRRLKGAMGEAAVFDGDDFAVGRFAHKPYICLFNWDDAPATVSARVGGAFDAYDFFTDRHVGTFDGLITLSLPAHGAASLRLERRG